MLFAERLATDRAAIRRRADPKRQRLPPRSSGEMPRLSCKQVSADLCRALVGGSHVMELAGMFAVLVI